MVAQIPGIGQATEVGWDLVLKRNSIERLKQEKFPLDILHELPELIARGYEAIPEEDIVRLNWWGLTHDKPKVGTFMVRIKVPGGRITPDQLIAVGRISQKYGRNYGELTTRQGIQLHWVRLEQLPEVLAEIQACGLTTVGGEGDTVRNITSCPVAGVDREELFDVRPVVEAVARFFYGNREYSNLPRKHKYTISACPAQCNAPEIHDVALVGVLKGGRRGFAVRVGGGLSATPRLSRDLGVFVPAEPVEGVVEVLRAITDTWQYNLRYRLSRAKARIKFLVDDYGPEKVRAMVEERLGHRLEDGSAPPPLQDTDHLGIHPQKQEGLVYVGIPVPMGWVRGDQLVALGELVGEFGGDARFTRMQNILVTGVSEERLGWLVDRLRRFHLDPHRNKLYGRSTACTDHQFCNYSVAETKGKLQQILETLEQRFGKAVEELRIYMDGCPHACAHHWVGDIGLQGTTTQHPTKGVRVEAYDVCLRGGLGSRAAIGKPILRRIPEDQITEVVGRLVEAWLRERARHGDGYTFRDFVDAHTDDALQALALGRLVGEEEAPRRPVVRIPGMFLPFTGGADRVEVEARTVREALQVLRTQYPQLAPHLLAPDGQVHPGINLFVDEEDIRGLAGLDTPLCAGQELTILPALSGG
ncbi:MAG: MoaD/ThiS family protein [Armatimonadetes bacterium]|nr:MoaD/ThiS family protein [Armatimonadota bacterium]MDW8152889.1 MoaD/ThiS family protein [Armatimonadota bacterium]